MSCSGSDAALQQQQIIMGYITIVHVVIDSIKSAQIAHLNSKAKVAFNSFMPSNIK